MEGGVKELIKHYENDVFGRRDKLLKKCHHLQKIIDQYVERMQRDPKIKNRNIVKEDSEKENSMNEQGIICEENVLSSENKTPMESSMTEEDRTEIQMTLDDIGNEIQLTTEENTYTNTEIEQTEPVYIENSDVEVKDGYQKNVENIKIDTIDLGDRKINYKRTTDTKISDLKIDLLAPLVVKPCNSESLLNTNHCESKDLISLKHLYYSKYPEEICLKKNCDNICPPELQEPEYEDFEREFDEGNACYNRLKPISRKLYHMLKVQEFKREERLIQYVLRKRRAKLNERKAGPSNKK